MADRKIKGIGIFHSFIIREDTFFQHHLEQIQNTAPGAEIIEIKSIDDWNTDVAGRCAELDVFFGVTLNEWIDKLPGLKWAQLCSAGVDHVLKSEEVIDRDILITNASGVHAVPLSEHILSLILAFGRKLNYHMRCQFQGKWDRRVTIQELEGSTLGLIGVGSIGGKTAEKCKALGMNVLGVRRNPEKKNPFVDHMFGSKQLKEMLALCDWVVVTAAGTTETDGMIGEAELAAMKETAVLINIARGSLIREKDLILALQGGLIAGAGLDVFETEPLPEESPLWKMPNVIITPHVAGGTPHYVDRLMKIFVENLKRYQTGESMINVVDKTLGY